MADTVRTLSAVLALLTDNTAGEISPQDLRDAIISCYQGPTPWDQSPQEILDDAEVIDITSPITLCSTTAPASNTLADGTDGQRKIIILVTGNDQVIVPANAGEFTSVSLDNTGATLELIFINDAWYILSSYDCTVT